MSDADTMEIKEMIRDLSHRLDATREAVDDVRKAQDDLRHDLHEHVKDESSKVEEIYLIVSKVKGAWGMLVILGTIAATVASIMPYAIEWIRATFLKG